VTQHIPATKTAMHPSGDVVEFYEDEHVYSFKNRPELTLTSATTWISQFFPDFDRDRISANYAKKHNMHQEDVLAAWDRKAEIARNRGTLVHARAEEAIDHFLERQQCLDVDELLCDPEHDGVSDDPSLTNALIRSMHLAVSKMSQVLDFTKTEQVIASAELGLAGMIDLVVSLRTDHDCPVVGLYDWKTNAKITRHNQWQSGLEPINHLSDCNFNHYALQLNLYEYICRQEGYFPPETVYQKVLIHLTADGYETYKCPDLQHNIKAMLEWSNLAAETSN
jgi:hypothetical protein